MYREKRRNLLMIFIDLEKAYYWVPREVLCGVLKKKRIPIVYVKIIQDMYDKGKTSVKSGCKETEDFTVKVGVYQSSALSPYLFAVIMDELTKGV